MQCCRVVGRIVRRFREIKFLTFQDEKRRDFFVNFVDFAGSSSATWLEFLVPVGHVAVLEYRCSAFNIDTQLGLTEVRHYPNFFTSIGFETNKSGLQKLIRCSQTKQNGSLHAVFDISFGGTSVAPSSSY